MSRDASGVDLPAIDRFGREAQRLAATTSNLIQFGWRVVDWSRGESCILIEDPDGKIFGFVDEGLGSKNRVAQMMMLLVRLFRSDKFKQAPESFWYNVGICAVAMIVNDMITLGVMPLVINQHLSFAGNFLEDDARWQAFLEGWRDGCVQSCAPWGGGETAGLAGLVVDGEAVIKGASFGQVPPGCKVLNPEDIRPGDQMVGALSAGIHSNGLTTAREVGEELADGFLTVLDNGLTYGEALCRSTIIYRRWVQRCMEAGLRVRYGVNMTGHGWLKIMRPNFPFWYMINDIPEAQQEFDIIQMARGFSTLEMYTTFNMGLGFVLIIHPDDVERALKLALGDELEVQLIGTVEASPDGTKQVNIQPLGLILPESLLNIRAA